MTRNGLLTTIAALGLAVTMPTITQAAATFIVINNDGAGEGFNDATPAAPVGGNTGTTIGQQRLIAFQHAANIWGARLTSGIPIRVQAQFNPLTCSASSAVLGSAGFINAFRDFTGAPVAGTWYAVALGNALHGADLDPAANDINAQFSSTIGTPGCLETSGWYYGLDANSPANRIDFVTVLLHELGHGLGFATLVNLGSGAKALGFDDAYMRHLENHGAAPPDYPAMTNAQRVAASTATGNLHWTGAQVRAASGVLSAGAVGDHVRMYAPNPQRPGSSVSHFDTVLTPNQLMEPSYTVPLHNPVLELPLFRDLGWTASPPGGNDLLVDFGASGLWIRLNNVTWTKVSNSSPVLVGSGDLDNSGKDEAIASVAPGGLVARYNNTATWTQLTSLVPTVFAVGNLNGGGEDIIADLGASGIYVYYNNATWTKLHNGPAQDIETGDLDGNGQDEALVDFGASGLWVRLNNSSWTKLHNTSPTHIATGDLDNNGRADAIVDLGASGIWVRYNNTTWTQLHTATSQGIETGDLDADPRDDVVIDFGAGGLWVFSNNTGFSQLHASSPTAIAIVDLDGNGQDNVVANFGGPLFVRTGGTWVQVHPGPVQVFTGGAFD